MGHIMFFMILPVDLVDLVEAERTMEALVAYATACFGRFRLLSSGVLFARNLSYSKGLGDSFMSSQRSVSKFSSFYALGCD